MKKALITGITGQDGSYLAEFLLNKGYLVYGLVRRTSNFNRKHIESLHDHPNFSLIYGDLSDSSSISSTLYHIMPDEIYNLAAQSHVKISFAIPEYTGDVNGIGVVRILEIIRKIKEDHQKSIKFYQASTSELFGKTCEFPQRETTPFYPRSPYGISKLYAYWIAKNYRESYNLFTCNGILFNHESPRRGENFVTRKITMEVAKIKTGMKRCIYLGNLDAKRDWGHARDYVEAMWLMIQSQIPDDYIIATGEQHSVRDFLETAFEVAGIPVQSNGKKGADEEYMRTDTGDIVVKIDARYYRPTEVDSLVGDYTKAKHALGWHPKITFKELVKEMIDADIHSLNHK